ncbi:hypothetical protein [Paenibacillus sp. FSL L8-0709]|uniref:hypothetical protein n=1 Tax=Paenibacillus sp. FSL L8-0709 TaxID=2975312 RepID=UPI0030F941B9
MALQIKVLRKDIERGHIETYLKQLNMAEKKKSKARSSVVLRFEGYENEVRAMHKVPEVSAWVRRFLKNKPHLFYYLENYSPYFLRSIALCLLENTDSYNLLPSELRNYVNTEYDHQKIYGCIERVLNSALLYSGKLKDEAHDQNVLREYILFHSGYYELNLKAE